MIKDFLIACPVEDLTTCRRN